MVNKKLAIDLSVLITKQDKAFVAYSPALDISTSGKSEKEVKVRFQELIGIFFKEIIEAGTVNEVLSELGWKKGQKNWTPPKVVSATSIGFNIPVLV